MYRILLLLMLFCLGKTLSAQHVYTIKADSVKITNNCDTAELIIENHTQNVPGFLFNKGSGRTEFRKGLVKLNDSLYRIGVDTLKILKPPVYTASNGLSMVGNSVQLGNLVLPQWRSFLNMTKAVWLPDLIPSSAINRFTSDRIIDLNTSTLYLYKGKLNLSGFYTGAFLDTLLFVNARGGVGLMVNMNDYFETPYSMGRPLVVRYNDRSVFQIKAEGQRVVTEFSDNVTDSTYLNIRPNNITPGNADNIPYDYGVRGVINLRGRYEQSDNGYGVVAGIYDTSWYNPTESNNYNRINYCGYYCSPRVNTTSFSTGLVRGVYYESQLGASGSIVSHRNIAFENRNGDVLLNNQYGELGGRTSIHLNAYPAAWLHLGAGMNTAETAPLKFTGGQVLDIPEPGAVEYDGTDLYLTTGTVRYKLSKTLTGQLTTNFGGPSLTALNSVTTTLSVAGAQPGDVVMVNANSGVVNPPSISITAYVTSANTVTLRAYNAGNSAVTIASDTYKVRVLK